MLKIVFKDIYQSRKVILLGLLVGLFFIISIDINAGSQSIVKVSLFILVIVFSVVSNNEYNESKNRGYYFLRTLPINNYKIVAGKFLTPPLIMILSIVYIFIVVLIYLGADAISSMFIREIITSASITLIFIGIFYILVYKIGAAKAINFSRIIFLLIFFSPFLINMLMDAIGLQEEYSRILEKSNMLISYIIIVFAVILYLICFNVSMKLFKKHKFY